MSNEEMKELDKQLWNKDSKFWDKPKEEKPYHEQPLWKIRADAKKIFGNPYRYAPEPMTPKEAMDGKGDYVGGKHYNRLPDQFQPAEISHAWGLDFLLWNTVKYLSRAGHKEGTNMSNKEKEVDDLKKGIDYMRMRINVLQGRTPLDFGCVHTQLNEADKPNWLDEPMESFNKRWNPDTMKEANEKYSDYRDNIEYYTNIAKAEGRELGEVDEDGIPL